MSLSLMLRHSELAVTGPRRSLDPFKRSNRSSRSVAHWTICPLGRGNRVDGTHRADGNLCPNHVRVRFDVLPKEKQREDFDEDGGA